MPMPRSLTLVLAAIAAATVAFTVVANHLAPITASVRARPVPGSFLWWTRFIVLVSGLRRKAAEASALAHTGAEHVRHRVHGLGWHVLAALLRRGGFRRPHPSLGNLVLHGTLVEDAEQRLQRLPPTLRAAAQQQAQAGARVLGIYDGRRPEAEVLPGFDGLFDPVENVYSIGSVMTLLRLIVREVYIERIEVLEAITPRDALVLQALVCTLRVDVTNQQLLDVKTKQAHELLGELKALKHANAMVFWEIVEKQQLFASPSRSASH